MNRRPVSKDGQAGFSMVEMLVAVVLLATGLLALAGTTGAVTELMVRGTKETQSAMVASSRFEILQGTLCASIASGTATTGAYSEVWTVTTIGTYTRKVKEVVSFSSLGHTKTHTLITHIRCKTS